MARLDYEEFKEYCMKNVVKVLGGSKYEATSQPIQSSDEIVIDSVQIKEKNMKPGYFPSFRVQPYYLDYCNGKTLGEVMLDIIKTIEGFLDKPLVLADPSIFNTFDEAKDNLIIRPISYKKNKKLLENHIYKRHGDIAIVLYMLMQQSNESMGTAKVARKIANQWELNEDFLLQTALENTARLFPPLILPLELTFQGNGVFPQIPANHKFFMNPLIPFTLIPSVEFNAYYLSTERGTNGASAAFYPGVLETLGSILDDDLYLSLSCIHEAVIHPVSKSDVGMISHGASSLISFLDPLEQLSPFVYHYSRSDKELRML